MAVVHVRQDEAAPVIRELLAAAQRLGLPASVVKTSSDGFFGFSLVVPDEVLATLSPEQQAAFRYYQQEGAKAAKRKKAQRIGVQVGR